MNKWLAITLLALATGVVVVGTSVNTESPEEEAARIARENCSTTNYSHGIFYFPCSGDKFGKTLAKFIDSRPTSHIVALSENGTGRFGKNVGYYVIIEP